MVKPCQACQDAIGVSERVVPQKETISTLESIWKYNLAPDAFDYQLRHKVIKGPRIYATQGEAATIMCTWPYGGDDKAVPGMENREQFPKEWSGPGIYFDEAMNGFEYQVAAHMVYEGLLETGLATTRAVHDRYTANKRNLYNEIECSDHYSRSMASYAVFLAVCRYDYHGPKGHLALNPKLSPDDFRAPFMVAEGWGSFSQKHKDGLQHNGLQLTYGKLVLNQLDLKLLDGVNARFAVLKINGKIVDAKGNQNKDVGYRWKLNNILKAGDTLESEIRL
ncbi:glycoside hydrolase family 116 protein [Muricauda sp. SCSIO 64092]|uniref:glycoside hydrolase family 116 protein n=1 Tax=Allomuricauda sp. SCSIO 64092 TaxID=2908842 RepID=UPI001FF46031|nr:glycoside hydrolase family 116 protein [Muricauda sp. SCSIO 64092]UOY04960.1 glycoside hydrolase family 116 protein [Muricauda sp. SCSIO 64092]